MHVFGHTHIPVDLDLDGTYHVQWPLGSPREQARQCARVRRHGPLEIYATDGGVARLGSPGALERTAWGEYYATHDRDPAATELALVEDEVRDAADRLAQLQADKAKRDEAEEALRQASASDSLAQVDEALARAEEVGVDMDGAAATACKAQAGHGQDTWGRACRPRAQHV